MSKRAEPILVVGATSQCMIDVDARPSGSDNASSVNYHLLPNGKTCPPNGAGRIPKEKSDTVTNPKKNRVEVPTAYHLVT